MFSIASTLFQSWPFQSSAAAVTGAVDMAFAGASFERSSRQCRNSVMPAARLGQFYDW
jgi:hypothetical protein